MLPIIRVILKRRSPAFTRKTCRTFSNDAEETPDDDVQQPSLVVERLKSRSMLSVTGPDAFGFVDSLITNDVNLLNTGLDCIFSFFLNSKGRVVHDVMLYKAKDTETSLFIECDNTSLHALQVHMSMFKAKHQVDIKAIEHEMSVWNICNPRDVYTITRASELFDCDNCMPQLEDIDFDDEIIITRDPRMPPLGLRAVAPKEVDIMKLLRSNGVNVSRAVGEYKEIRYKLAIAEGTKETSYGRNFPLELNGDFTNAVSVKKAAYLGYHTNASKNIVENRMMPLALRAAPNLEFPENSPINDDRGRKRSPVGYLRGVVGALGIGMMNVQSVMQCRHCKIDHVLVKCIRPLWWPFEEKRVEKTAMK